MPGIRLKTNTRHELSAGVLKFQISNRDTKAGPDWGWSYNRPRNYPAGDAEGLVRQKLLVVEFNRIQFKDETGN